MGSVSSIIIVYGLLKDYGFFVICSRRGKREMMLVNTRAGRTKRRDGRETVVKYYVVLLFLHMG